MVLEEFAKLQVGASVRVDLLDEQASDEQGPSLFDRLEPVIGKAKGLPPDAASNVDRALYGRSRP